MSLNSDDFEQRLVRQPPRQIPPEWRTQILSKAYKASHSSRRSQTKADHVSFWRVIISTLNSQPSTLLWPSPKAWAFGKTASANWKPKVHPWNGPLTSRHRCLMSKTYLKLPKWPNGS